MTWTTQGNLSFIDLGQGVMLGACEAVDGQPAFVQLDYKGGARMDAVDVSEAELQGIAKAFGAQFFMALADACEGAE